MRLTRRERTALHRIETQLMQGDPELERLLRALAASNAPAADAPPSWRPPRVAVAVAAAVVAVTVFFLTVMALSATRPCSPTGPRPALRPSPTRPPV